MNEQRWCRVCVRDITGTRRVCERCRTRRKRGSPPVEPEARLVRCRSCHREYAVPFGARVPTACSGPCEARRLEWSARNAEVRAARRAWEAREAERQANAPASDSQPSEPIYGEQLMREVDPIRPWMARSVWRRVLTDVAGDPGETV